MTTDDRETVTTVITGLDFNKTLVELAAQINDLVERQRKGEFWDAKFITTTDLFYGMRVSVRVQRLETDDELSSRINEREKFKRHEDERQMAEIKRDMEEYERLKKKFEGQ